MSTIHGTHMNELHQKCKRVMSPIRMRHVTHTVESCHTYGWVTAHTYIRVMSDIRMSHVTHMNEACHTNEWVVSHICMSHVTRVYHPCHTYVRVTASLPLNMSTSCQVTLCNTLHHTAETLQHTAAAHCNTMQHTATHCITLYHTAIHYNTVATHCNIL